MSLDHAILGFLRHEDLSGYDLKTRCFETRSSHFWTADQAQIYRTLDRLQRSKYVTVRTRRQSGRPDRKVFAISRAGNEALAEWLATPHPLPAHRDPFLMQLAFAEELSDESLIGILATQRDLLQDRLSTLRGSASAHARESGPRPSRRDILHRMTLDGCMAECRASIDWLDDCIETLGSFAAQGKSQGALFRPETTGGDAR